MEFKKRIVAPSTTNKYYLKYTKGGYNKAMEIDPKTHSCLSNCTGLVHGRWLESMGSTNPEKDDKLCLGNAENYFGYTKDGYKRGQTPKLGAIICWRKGKAGNESDGAGHVAHVEDVKSNGDIVTSNSARKGLRFYTKTLTKKSNYFYKDGYTFQGFIYSPVEFTTEKPKETKKYYIVQKGDYVIKIAKKFNVKWTSIIKLNGLKFPYVIKVGQKLRVK